MSSECSEDTSVEVVSLMAAAGNTGKDGVTGCFKKKYIKLVQLDAAVISEAPLRNQSENVWRLWSILAGKKQITVLMMLKLHCYVFHDATEAAWRHVDCFFGCFLNLVPGEIH